MPPCLTLSIIRYRSRVSGSIQGKDLRHPLHLDVVAIEKGVFWSPETTVDQFTKMYIMNSSVDFDYKGLTVT